MDGDAHLAGTPSSPKRRRPATLRALYASIAALVMAGAALAIAAPGRTTAAGRPSTTSPGKSSPPAKPPVLVTSPSPTTTAPATPRTVPTTPPAKPAPQPPALGHGLQGTVSQIPWTEVGPGWTLALWSPVASWVPKGPESLFLVDPVGGRYLITASAPSNAQLAGWTTSARIGLLQLGSSTLVAVDLGSGDTLWRRTVDGNFETPSIAGNPPRVLLPTQHVQDPSDPTEMIDLDLSTGAILHDFTVPGPESASYATPDGLSEYVNAGTSLRMVTLDGATEVDFPSSFSKVGTFDGHFLPTPGGRSLLMATQSGVALVSDDGSVLRQLPFAAGNPYAQCQPQRWWAPGVALVSCAPLPDTVWLVPVSGGAPKPLAPGAQISSVWQVGGTLFSEFGGCVDTWIERQEGKGFVNADIPGVIPTDRVVAATATQLEALGVVAACDAIPSTPAPAAALVLYTPSTNTSLALLGPAVDGGTVLDAEPYPAGGWS